MKLSCVGYHMVSSRSVKEPSVISYYSYVFFFQIFGWSTHLQILLFPYVQYPLQAIALTGSIFMTVSISFERYVAVHNPINYNRAMNDAKATRRRVLRYAKAVFLL